MMKKYRVVVLLLSVIMLLGCMIFLVCAFLRGGRIIDETGQSVQEELSADAVFDLDDSDDSVVIVEDKDLNESSGTVDNPVLDNGSDTVPEDVLGDTQEVTVGNCTFDISGLYEDVPLDTDEIYGVKLLEYDRESGMIVFGHMESKVNLEQYMFQMTSQLIDSDEYVSIGISSGNYGGQDWTLNLYKSKDDTTGSLIGCTTVDGQFTCVFLHCLWTDETETEFVNILSSIQKA